ncbi:hypothetical protein ACFFU1_03875 [Algibacter miyuki]|uniref:Transporter n=1 Tax=Algibacter miyuki TaxID=1306933 RepID=A0ABV5GWM0_9FLAO|nr:hypothetical protein [Algibacter miyuki]MDN3664265.1 hypothetical protein [Algibacter miyuki]
MKLKINFTAMAITALFLAPMTSKAQGLVDGFFNKKGEANISLSYSSSVYDAFYVGKTKVDGVPAHNEISQDIINLYANYAITDRLTAIASLPYISSEGKGVADPVNGTTEQSDLQDLSIMVKYALYIDQLKNGSMTYFAAAGGSIPMGYESNGILSLGTGAPALDGKLGMHYQNNFGLFGTVVLGATVRGEADNEFNIGDGQDFNAPNSLNTLIKLGYCNNSFYVDAWFDAQSTSDKGVDIAGPGFANNFPETRVSYSRVGGDLFIPIVKNFGISAGIGTIVDGRNIGKATTYTGGIVYSIR